ncbi:NAD-dependent aldehyde dehydrogenase [Acidovorax sp. CF316]|uniref:aldehyde dehydrogenase family protein n=1 Tax=Acidovorax sp. CF316 TaxID=1144317 RepID=UPI00026BE1C9|nr:aldehyde dehydrogenase family protein [Acidovorax sp. CF316]EJE52863.1 NAD-dependent aldehyde dehydrogenase [Acidovorax sp. CF316]
MPPLIDHTTHFIAGRWSAPDTATFPDRNPFTDEVVAQVAAGTRQHAQAAIDAAHAAFPAWAAMPPGQRQRLFLAAADIVERRAEDFVRLLAAETGTASGFARFQIRWSVDLLRQAAGWGYRPAGDVLRSDTPGRFAMAVRKPLGVVAGFAPWNGAFCLAWRTVVLPMAFGNTMVLKPSEEAPLSAGLVLAEVLEEAGFPAGTFNVVTHGPGDAGPIADAFFESPHVRSINFTGSSATGRMLAERAGRALKRIVLELGGYNPLLVLDDADLDLAVNTTAFGAFFHQGQICMNTRKVLVDRSIADAFVEKLAAKTRSLPMGDPAAPGTVIGPLINDRALAQVRQRVDEAVALGARVVTGGRANGRVYEPTILVDVPATAPVSCEETFGPVLIVQPVDNPEQAMSEALATPYGLCAGILTRDAQRGLALAERFDCGMVHINGATMAGEPAMPNGGVKDSGWGRSGHYAIEDFTEVRLTTLTQGALQYPV